MAEPSDSSAPDQPVDAARHLVEYVRHRDVVCPRCDYSLRNAVSAACPECGEPLRLTVGLERPILGALLLTIAPALGCGVCGLIFIVLFALLPGAPAMVILVALLLVLSGIMGIAIAVGRRRFLRQSRSTQAAWAVASIIANILLVLLFIAAIVYGR